MYIGSKQQASDVAAIKADAETVKAVCVALDDGVPECYDDQLHDTLMCIVRIADCVIKDVQKIVCKL